ncbi:MAG: RNA 2',3'-cyclic phosphodiesterase, partial [Chloroflexota bacterium]
MADRVRLFVGINLDDSWTDGLAAVSDELRQTIGSGPRWVQPPLFHVTVVFLGDQSTKGVELAGQALRGAAAAASPFLLHLTEVHRLGGHEHGALVAGVADRSGGLRQLRVLLDQELRYHRVAFDAKPLVPHITLARPRR